MTHPGFTPSPYDDFQLTRVKDYVIGTLPAWPEGDFCQRVWENMLARDYDHLRKYYQSPAIAQMRLCKEL